MLARGFLLDCYPSRDGAGMTFWLKTPEGQAIKLRDSKWHARIYASGSACSDKNYVLKRIQKDADLVHSISYANKIDDYFSAKKHRVLEFKLKDASKIKRLAVSLERAFQNPDYFQLYNVDLLPEQEYFYEHDLFPLGFVEAEVSRSGEVRRWSTLDSIAEYDYETPDLKTLRLDVGISDIVPRMDSKLRSIELSSENTSGEKKTIATIEGKSEASILADAMEEIKNHDPDLVITKNGDSFVLPFLYSKAIKFSIESIDLFNRDSALGGNALIRKAAQGGGGKTYFSYGRILYRPSTQRLFGRLHLDEQNTFIYDQCMLEGLFEVSRLCRIPLHTSMRASIGKCLSSLQAYYASKDGILIPWKPETVEDPKNAYELFVADRGGLVLKPLPGVHEHVGEVDFASLYPSIIRKYNISAETVNCQCCSNSKYQIEELGMHICERREGIIARSLVLPLDKRFEYKRLRDAAPNERLKRMYNERAGSLKWILVCCLARESTVLIQKDGHAKRVEIGDFIDDLAGDKIGILNSPENIYVAGVDSELTKSKFCKVKKLFKIPNRQKLLRILMDGERKIVATPNHPCYLLSKEGKFVVERASKLRLGDFIPVAKTPWSVVASEPSSPPRCVNSTGMLLSFADEQQLDVLGFARIRKIEELDRANDDFVYCFQLDEEEVPGFFAGDGAVFTHNCFGYLSYRNAKFGKIDSHIAVCSVARKTLIEAMHTAEYSGFRVIHGIVDSLWLAKERATVSDYEEVAKAIEKNTGFSLAIEGIYKWIVFLPSKTYSKNQVANRYFGAFEDGSLKVRGIELRRHDAPLYFKKCQERMLSELAKCDGERELRECARWKCVEIFEEFAKRLEDRKVEGMELIITRRLSKNPSEYSSERQLSVNAALRLSRQGLELKAGQSVSYVITRYKSQGKERSIPEQELSSEIQEYDSERYVELLADACATVLSPFGVTKRELLSRSLSLTAFS